MFCKWCGMMLSQSDTSCSRCGKEAPPLSNCSGFHGLVQLDADNKIRVPFSENGPEKDLEPGPKKPQFRKLVLATGATVLTLVLLLAIFAFCRAGQQKKQVGRLQEELYEAADEINSLKDEYAALSERLGELTEDLWALKESTGKPEAPPEGPAEPEGNKPAVSAEKEPAEPMGEEPTEQEGNEPAGSMEEEPAEPMGEEPTELEGNESARSMEEEPAEPMGEEPTELEGNEPAGSMEEEPAEPVNKESKEGNTEGTEQ